MVRLSGSRVPYVEVVVTSQGTELRYVFRAKHELLWFFSTNGGSLKIFVIIGFALKLETKDEAFSWTLL